MTTWERYIEYRCRCCHEMCINSLLEGCTRHRECHRCFAVPDLAREPVDEILPSLRWATIANELGFIPSPGEVRRVSASASAPSAGSAEAAGSDPSRVDPEAGAQRRRPAGGGQRHGGSGKPQWRLNDPQSP